MPESAPRVALRGVTKSFGSVRAVRGVDLELHAGEVHALVGENGAGKSTIVKMLAGIHRPDAGRIEIDGAPVQLHSAGQARDHGIAVIHQQPALFPDLDIAENVFMGRPPRTRLGRVDWPSMYRQVEERFRQLRVSLDPRRPVEGLSMAEQQLVEIAKALSLQARVLVLDEPTAALSGREVEELLRIVRELREGGVAMLFVSHHLEEVFAISDRVTVLRDGSRVAVERVAGLTIDATIRHMVGRSLDALYPKEPAEIGAPLLEVDGLSRSGAFRDVSFAVRAGEILGFAGLVGAGRSEVARVLFGIDRADAGEVRIGGSKVAIGSPGAAVRHGLAYVPEDRHHQGLVLELAIGENIALANLDRVSTLRFVRRAQERRLARDYFARLDIRATGIEQLAGSLSGGNQQKVVLAKWLATQPRVLILDEPTHGIDVGTKAEVHRLISRLAGEGMAIILISSELPEVLAMSDRVLVFHEGRIAGEFAGTDADPEQVMALATGQDGHVVGP